MQYTFEIGLVGCLPSVYEMYDEPSDAIDALDQAIGYDDEESSFQRGYLIVTDQGSYRGSATIDAIFAILEKVSEGLVFAQVESTTEPEIFTIARES